MILVLPLATVTSLNTCWVNVPLLCPPQVLCWLVEPVSAVIQSLSSSALTDLLQELQGNEGQLAVVLHNKVPQSLQAVQTAVSGHLPPETSHYSTLRKTTGLLHFPRVKQNITTACLFVSSLV